MIQSIAVSYKLMESKDFNVLKDVKVWAKVDDDRSFSSAEGRIQTSIISSFRTLSWKTWADASRRRNGDT